MNDNLTARLIEARGNGADLSELCRMVRAANTGRQTMDVLFEAGLTQGIKLIEVEDAQALHVSRELEEADDAGRSEAKRIAHELIAASATLLANIDADGIGHVDAVLDLADELRSLVYGG